MKCTQLLLVLSLASPFSMAGDKSSSYQEGVYITSAVAADGTTTDNISCGSGPAAVCNGGIRVNGVTIYQIKVAGGRWQLETYRQASDSMARRNLGFEAPHLKAEKSNPLDLLKNGDRVLFRLEKHRKLNGTETDIFIPYADNPDKEVKFVGWFVSDVPVPAKPTDNVKAMCDAHKLSPEAEKQFCQPSPATPTLSDQQKEEIKRNSEAGKSSPAAAAAMAADGHASTPEELAELVKAGKASRCAVITTPAGAEVFVDGNKAGLTPFVFVLMKRDAPRTITVKMEGYKSVEKQYEPDGSVIPIALQLEKE